MILLLAALVLQDPFEEPETRAEEHLKKAGLAESADLAEQAFYHYERVIDTCAAATGEQLAKARAGRAALLKSVPPNTDEKKATRWSVLAVVCRSYAFRFGDDKRNATYRVGDDTIKALREGLTAFEKMVWEASGGHLKVDVKVLPMDEPVRSLRREDDGYWMSSEELERNFPKLKVRDGEVDQVFVYLVGDAKSTIPFVEKARWGGRWHFARYWNFMLTPDEAAASGGTVESYGFVRSLRGVLDRYSGYNPKLIPDVGENPNEGCCSGRSGLEWYRHICEAHVTTRMWAEAPPGAPSTPFFTPRLVLVSDRYPNADDKGLGQAHLNEQNADLDVKGWAPVKAPDDAIDLNRHFTGTRGQGARGTCYLATYVYVKKGQWAKMNYGATDHVRLFVNGVDAGFSTERRDSAEPDDRAFRFYLKEGRNLLLVKTASNDVPWAFIARLSDLRGGAVKGEIVPVRK
jgi:hypothetical protein